MSEKADKTKEIALKVMLEYPTLNFGEMAQKIGITDRQFKRIRQDEDFKAAYNAACREQFDAIQKLAIDKLNELVESGNFNAVKYALDGVGYAATQKVDVSASDIHIQIGGKEDEE